MYQLHVCVSMTLGESWPSTWDNVSHIFVVLRHGTVPHISEVLRRDTVQHISVVFRHDTVSYLNCSPLTWHCVTCICSSLTWHCATLSCSRSTWHCIDVFSSLSPWHCIFYVVVLRWPSVSGLGIVDWHLLRWTFLMPGVGDCRVVCWSLTSLCHSNGHIETMPAREINPFTALTRIRSQFLRTQWSTSNHQRVDTTTPPTAQTSGLAWRLSRVCWLFIYSESLV